MWQYRFSHGKLGYVPFRQVWQYEVSSDKARFGRQGEYNSSRRVLLWQASQGLLKHVEVSPVKAGKVGMLRMMS